MTDQMPAAETLEFRAEVQQLLHILAHSLYTEREIFLRELVSNASDALHRMQFELLTNRHAVDPDAELAIRIESDPDAHTLTVSDTGIGMTRDELIENLGTIAHSGALAFLKKIGEGQKPVDLIGQFGVGFYSVFMVADEVVVTSRSYQPDATAWRWTSRGDSRFDLAPADKATRGTEVLIRLKEDAHDFTIGWRLSGIVRKHSDYVSFPVYVKGEVANRQDALWRKPPREVKDEEYVDFYRQLTLDPEPPLLHTHLVTDAPVDIRSILFVPRRLDRSALSLRSDYGLQLYSRKVLIQAHNKELLPEHLRFVEGVVDSEDIPLNVSRETVQSNRTLRAIQKVLAGRVVKVLAEFAAEKPEEYAGFWQDMGVFIKQGVATGEKEDLPELLRFTSTASDGKLVSLADYAGRMIDGQNEIYYLLGGDPSSVGASPHLDAFRSRGIEVLLMGDPFDGFMVHALPQYKDKQLRNIDDPGLVLPGQPQEAADAEASLPDDEWAGVVARVKTVLGGRVTEVRESQLLTGHPARLVSPNAGFEREMQRLRRMLEQDYQIPPKILELNRRHPLMRNLASLIAQQPANAMIDASIELLFENLLLLEGLHPNPAALAPRIQSLLEQATRTAAGSEAAVD